MGISGFEPTFLVGLRAIHDEHGQGLAALGGRRLIGFALVRFVEDGDWYADCPVVLDFDGVQVEVSHSKFDELSIGWNTIDTTAAITGWEEDDELTPVWSSTDERLEPFVGQELREVALLGWQPSGRDMAAGTLAVEFVFDVGHFHIANALDENSIEVGDTHPEWVRHQLSCGT
ncbi:hypothetical protein [Nonomuraea sp. NPDC050643]|uniref:hypothetical protein n=1 Tax=Nonomuraea sp. NPDC050643 TaxID=3155660 RepID=UPI0033F2A937